MFVQFIHTSEDRRVTKYSDTAWESFTSLVTTRSPERVTHVESRHRTCPHHATQLRSAVPHPTTDKELKRISQVLTNNGYSKEEIDDVIRHRMNNYVVQEERDTSQDINLYYKNHMSSSYKADEKSPKKIVQANVKPVEPTAELKLIIYYKTRRTSSLIIKKQLPPPYFPATRCEPRVQVNMQVW